MKVGIITDTHDRPKYLAKIIDVFSEHKVSYILHAGDITTPATAEALAKIDHARFIAVFGNCDSDKISLESVIRRHDGEIHKGVCKSSIGEKTLIMAHNPRELGDATATDEYDLVVYGHTHEYDIHREGKTLVINPSQSFVVILELDNMDYEAVPL
jgi:putative phosphoesterase